MLGRIFDFFAASWIGRQKVDLVDADGNPDGTLENWEIVGVVERPADESEKDSEAGLSASGSSGDVFARELRNFDGGNNPIFARYLERNSDDDDGKN